MNERMPEGKEVKNVNENSTKNDTERMPECESPKECQNENAERMPECESPKECQNVNAERMVWHSSLQTQSPIVASATISGRGQGQKVPG
jgi:hypothetical protein